MPQFNLPRKLVSTIQLWASVGLIALTLIFSLMPIIKLKTVDNADEINEFIASMEIEGMDELPQMPQEVEISAIKLIGSATLIGDFVSIISETANAAQGGDLSEEDMEAFQAKQEAFVEYLKTDEGKENIVTIACIAFTVVKTLDFQGSDNIIAMIFNVLISVIGLIFVLALTFIIPIMLLVKLILSLIKAAKNVKTPENASAAIGAKLPGMISLPLLVMLMQCVVPDMTFAWGIVAVCITIVISAALNFVVSRLREYPAKQFVYLNILQGGALACIIGFLVFFFSIIKTGIFKAFVSGKYFLYLAEALIAQQAGATVNTAYIIDGVLMVVYLAIILGCVSYLDKAARRFSCTVKKERPKGLIGMFFTPKAKDNNVVMAVFTLVAFVVPTYIAGVKHGFNDITSTAAEGDYSFLELTAAQQGALTTALVGIIIMIVAEVAVIVLKKVFCKDLTEREAEDLMLGLALTTDEKLAEAQKFIEENAPVAEAPAVEEAPVAEEALAVEEAPVEEASTEEKQEATAE